MVQPVSFLMPVIMMFESKHFFPWLTPELPQQLTHHPRPELI